MRTPGQPLRIAAALGLAHALVDAATVGTVCAERGLGRLSLEGLAELVATYNIIAFGLQLPLGWLADRRGSHRSMAAAGLLLAAAGASAGPLQPLAATALAGLGNALFHVGAGAVVLGQWPGRAAGAGIFVAPGALGLALGIQQGLQSFPLRWVLAAALILAMGALLLAREPAPRPVAALPRRPALAVAAALLLLSFSVSIRSLAGEALAGPWRGIPAAAWGLTAAAVAGKALGGIAADRWGWRTVPAAALLLSIPLAGAAADAAGPALLGMLLIQASMAVTLAATSWALPGRPGTAFGLPSLALVLWVILDHAGINPRGDWSEIIPAMPLASAAMIVAGITLLGRGRRRPAAAPARQGPPGIAWGRLRA